MNSNYPGGRRPQNRRPNNARPRPMREFNAVREEETAAPEKKSKSFLKVLITVIIMILSLLLITFGALFTFNDTGREDPGGWLGTFFTNPVKGFGMLFRPDVEGLDSWSDDGSPVIDDASRDGKDVFNFLVAGVNDGLGNNTDTLMLVQYRVGDGQINVVQIPRDTYIDVGYNFNKINSVYSAAYNGAQGGADERRVAGMEGAGDRMGLCEFIEQSYAVKIDYYVLIDLEGFQNLIDKLGGLRVNVPSRMVYNDPEQNLFIDLYPGEQTLTGYQAMCMVRNRKTYVDADYSRMNAQKIVLSALFKQVKEDFTADTIKGLIEFAFDNVTTNISLSDSIYFGTQALGVDMENLKMVTMPTNYYGGVVLTLETNCVEVVNEYLNVYDREITADDFDKGNRLTSTNMPNLHNEYLHGTINYEVYDADSVDKDSIDLKDKK